MPFQAIGIAFGLVLWTARLPSSLMTLAFAKTALPAADLKVGSWISALRSSRYGSWSAGSLR